MPAAAELHCGRTDGATGGGIETRTGPMIAGMNGRATGSRSTAASAIDVQVLESDDRPAHWSRLDDFEGPATRGP